MGNTYTQEQKEGSEYLKEWDEESEGVVAAASVCCCCNRAYAGTLYCQLHVGFSRVNYGDWLW